MLAVFDGHNDALTREDHAAIAASRSGGHLDLPRMHIGGVRGGIFAIFTPSSRARKRPLHRDDGVLEFELAPRLDMPRPRPTRPPPPGGCLRWSVRASCALRAR